MPRSIPPRTMRDVSRERRRRDPTRGPSSARPRGPRPSAGAGPVVAPFRKPRNWRFQTKPLFRKIKGPLVDVFHEAEEVLIVIDLGAFSRGDVSLNITPERYTISARRGDHQFHEEILLPPEVDIERSVEHFRNGVLEITLPRKKKT